MYCILTDNLLHTDRQLFVQIAQGDEAAFRTFFHQYNIQLFPFIKSLVKSEHDTKEIMQEAFLKLWQMRNNLLVIDNPGAWFRRVTANIAYDYLRIKARYELRFGSVEEHIPSVDQSFWKDIDLHFSQRVLLEALEQLPEKRRRIFHLIKIDGLSRKQTAQLLDLSENTVRNQLADAVTTVQEYFKKHAELLMILYLLMND